MAMIEQQYIAEILRTYAGADDPTSKLTLGALGLAGETGEVIDLIKKYVFQGHEIDQEKFRDELGDVLWYFMLICHTVGCSLEEVMVGNVEKLQRRYPHGFEAERSVHRQEALCGREDAL
jgi:NTP pyrophosphatase (non-canonical NTP hydrolase)